jgi:putative tryptophan/tyrosine transport system substrate-binding protein
MKRRNFIAGLGAAVWPLAAGAQRQSRPVIGFLSGGTPSIDGPTDRPFLQGLAETGYTEGQNVTIEYRWAEGHYDRLPALAADLVGRAVNVIAASPSQAALAAKAATTKIPIVFSSGADPVQAGLVARLNRPGGNLTGSSYSTVPLTTKRYEHLLEVIPKLAVTALLVNPTSPNAKYETKEILATASVLSRKVRVLSASSESEIDAAFATIVEEGIRALLLGNDAFFALHRSQIFELAIRHAIPAIYPLRVYAVGGGLMSYGTDVSDSSRQMGVYVGQVLRGEKPGDLPVQLPTKFELVVNIKTAKAIGLAIPEAFLLRANEVIE